MKKPIFPKLTIFLSSLVICFVLAEVAYRLILFSNNPAFNNLRKPRYYADFFSDDDYWKLYYAFGGKYKPPKHPHPLLGWVANFSPDSLIHNEFEHIRGRRPVLLYGDSFAGCVPDVLCFQDFLNNDEEFSKGHYLLNYGIGGYGLDQIFLLFRNSYHLFDDPFVIISLLTLDLDRSILTVRTGQKPYFRMQEEGLKLSGVPINQHPRQFFEENPPQIKSYIYRRILHSGYLPSKLALFLRKDHERLQRKKDINKQLILETVKELRTSSIDFVFVIFHTHVRGVTRLDIENDWRDAFLKQVLRENNIPYISSRDSYMVDSKDTRLSIDNYIIPGNGHPTSRFNRLIANEIKKYVLTNNASKIFEYPRKVQSHNKE